MKPKYYLYKAEIAPKQGFIRIVKLIKEGNNIRFLKTIGKEFVKQIPITVEIPLEEYTSTIGHFDNKALQMDDRFFTSEIKGIRYNPEFCNNLIKEALKEYNTNPILL